MKKILAAIVIVLSILPIPVLILKKQSQATYTQEMQHEIDCMPIVSDHPYATYGSNLDPIENRTESVQKWLAPSIKINVRGFSGSGTIIYYDDNDGYAYIQSCGHLWNGAMTATEGRQRKVTCTITVWYQNAKKLSASKNYPAEVLYYSNNRGNDISLLRFKPDWTPTYFPIAEPNYKITKGMKLHSTGCDDGREVAHYDVEALRYEPLERNPNWDDLITKNNSPRPGRSGGGLMSEDGFYVGICWGTSDKQGNGIGFFTPLHTIRHFNEANGYGWLNEKHLALARKIPVEDRNNPQGTYPKEYIPVPGR